MLVAYAEALERDGAPEEARAVLAKAERCLRRVERGVIA